VPEPTDTDRDYPRTKCRAPALSRLFSRRQSYWRRSITAGRNRRAPECARGLGCDAWASLLASRHPSWWWPGATRPTRWTTLTALCRARTAGLGHRALRGRAPLCATSYQRGAVHHPQAAPRRWSPVGERGAAAQVPSNEDAIAEGVRASFARLRTDHRRSALGLLATSVSLNLLNVVAESLDRGVLLVPDRDQLVAWVRLAKPRWVRNLLIATQTLAFPVGASGVLFECLRDSHTRRVSYDDAGLPQAFREAVDRPVSGEIVVLRCPAASVVDRRHLSRQRRA